MKIQTQFSILYQTTIALMLFGCISSPATLQNNNNTPSPVSTITISPSASSESYATIIAFPTNPLPIPTAISEQELQIFELLQTKDCNLPCYLGIIPGKINLRDAREALRKLGAVYRGDYKMRDGAIEYRYDLPKFGDLSTSNEPSTIENHELYINQGISLISHNDIVQIIEVGVDAGALLTKYREYWNRYSLREIFLQLGIPDQLYIDQVDPLRLEYTQGRTLISVYEKQGLVVELFGMGLDNNICPKNKARTIHLRLSLYNPNSGLSIYSEGRIPPTRRDVYLPVEEVLGVNTSEFYNQVLVDPSICFAQP